MISVFNRLEIINTYNSDYYSQCKDILNKNGIDYKTKVISVYGTGISNRRIQGSFGDLQKYAEKAYGFNRGMKGIFLGGASPNVRGV